MRTAQKRTPPRRARSTAGPAIRRQWGADRHSRVLPVMAAPPTRRAVSGARFAIFATVAAWVAYVVEQVLRVVRHDLSAAGLAEAIAYLSIVTLLTASAASYLVTRLGYLNRIRAHRRTPRAVLDAEFSSVQPTLTVIVPSYREQTRVIRQTLLSAALQEYPSMRVVLLIDDPPQPGDAANIELLRSARALPAEIESFLEGPRQLFEEALATFLRRADTPEAFVGADVLDDLAANYETAAQFFRIASDDYDVVDHSDDFLLAEVFERLITDLSSTGAALRTAAAGGAPISHGRAVQLYRRLVWIFQAEITSFERKRYASLSHEANKAMNLNSYIGLMGGNYRVESSGAGDVLLPTTGDRFDLAIANPDYVLTLDADSILLPDYCLRLVSFMEQASNAQVAVVQTPYSAYRGASQRIERIAGATTDLQHLVHQGLTAHGATFWVGANAVLRKTALDDIVVEEEERGFIVKRYVQDRTVIEDTESSIDLRAKGWRLHNYPERLSYSATPPDFGSLVVQRQRWANGGLVILPKLRALLGKDADGKRRAGRGELLLRLNYLASITWASLGLLVLLAYPFDDDLLSRLALGTAVPYFIAVANDLKRSGYKRTDVFRLYGFNLLLLPVNLSGTVKSVVQAIGGQKISFARTPKVADRTVAPLLFVTVPFLVVAWSAYTFARDLHEQSYIHAGFAAVNGLLTAYSVVAFVGVRHAIADVFLNLREKVYVPEKSADADVPVADWVTVLYHGTSEAAEHGLAAPLAIALAAGDQAEVVRHDAVHHRSRMARNRRRGDRRTNAPASPVLPAAPVPASTFRFDAIAADEHTAQLLADCVRMLSQSGSVSLRPDGTSVEVLYSPATTASATAATTATTPTTTTPTATIDLAETDHA